MKIYSNFKDTFSKLTVMKCHSVTKFSFKVQRQKIFYKAFYDASFYDQSFMMYLINMNDYILSRV